MLGSPPAHQPPGLLEEVGPEVGNLQMGQNALFGEEAQLTVDEPGDTVQLGDLIIPIFTAEKDGAPRPMDLRTCRDLNLDDPFPVDFFSVRKEEIGRIQFVRVVGEVGDLDLNPVHGIPCNPGDGPIIGHTQNYKPSIQVQKGANGIEEAAGKRLGGFLEFQSRTFVHSERAGALPFHHTSLQRKANTGLTTRRLRNCFSIRPISSSLWASKSSRRSRFRVLSSVLIESGQPFSSATCRITF